MMKTYQLAMDIFLEKFDFYWKETLQLLNNEQAQLTLGTRLRPQICLWGYLATILPDDISSHDYSKIANVAVSIELIHKASLLIDDWIDADRARHGYPAFHIEYTPEHTVLMALHMISLAMFRLKKCFPASLVLPQHYYLCLDTIIETIYSMAQGALKELRLQDSDLFNVEIIREITQLETAEIISNSFLLGYYVGIKESRDLEIENSFKHIGDQCGYLFQALNDLEFFCNPEKLEKHKGTLNSDYNVNRKNLAISMLFSVANTQDQMLLQNADEALIRQLMKKYQIIEMLTQELENVYYDILNTADKLKYTTLPLEWCEGLKGFLDYVKKFANKRLKK